MKSKTSSVCGLDFQKEYLSVVQYSPEENAVTLVSIQPYATEPAQDEWKQREQELKSIKGRLRFFSPNVTCGIPSENAIVKIFQVDSDERDLHEALQWELSQHIYGPVEEYAFDFQPIESADGAPVKKMLVAAYREDLVIRIAAIVRGVKFAPRGVDLDIFGLINVFEANYPEQRDLPSILVHSEPQTTKLVLTRGGAFLDFHCFDHPASSAESLGFSSALAEEIGRFTAANERPGIEGKSIGVYAAGALFQQADARKALLHNVEGAQMLNPFRSIKCQVAVDEQQLQEYSTQLAVAVGLALQGCPEGFRAAQ
jgi:Tfp pilus assembly PilM family ATPase